MLMFDFRAKGAWPRYFGDDKVKWILPYPDAATRYPIVALRRDEVAPFEREMMEAGISVNHMTSTQQRLEQAALRFYREMGIPNAYSPRYVGPTAWISFMVCAFHGCGVSHAPVFVLDGMPDQFDKRALHDAWMIPAPVDGVMPVVVTVFAGYGTAAPRP